MEFVYALKLAKIPAFPEALLAVAHRSWARIPCVVFLRAGNSSQS